MTSIRLKDTTDVVRRAAWVGTTEPTSDDTVTVGPGTLWIDDSTTPNVLKRRNDTDDGWVAVGLVTGTTAVTAAPGNHNHTHDSLTGRTTDNHHAKAHNVGDAAAHPDVLVTSPATGDALVYDATAVKWKNVPVAGGVTLSSANPTTAAPSDAAAPGTGLSATRGDHRHGMPATWPPTSHAHSAHSGLGADDHTQYQLRSERGSASGYAPLDSGLLVPVANLGTGTPTGSKFLRDDRTWAVPAGGGGGGGATINTGADASKGTGTSGDLYLPNDGFVVYRSTGSAQVPWGPVYPFTAPVDSDFAWINQGGASVSTTNGGIVLSAPTDSGTPQVRIRKKAAPATPYTITVALLPNWGTADNNFVCIGFRESSSGKLHLFEVDHVSGALRLVVAKWTDASTFSALYGSATPAGWLAARPLWLRIADDGTNRICSILGDGQNPTSHHSIGRTDFLTANEVLFGVRAAGSTVYSTLLSWHEA